MAKTEKRVFDSEEDLAVSLAKYIDHLSDQFAKKKGLFTVVLSGGSLIECLRFPFHLSAFYLSLSTMYNPVSSRNVVEN